jgi:hypothetical protein
LSAQLDVDARNKCGRDGRVIASSLPILAGKIKLTAHDRKVRNSLTQIRLMRIFCSKSPNAFPKPIA